MTHFYLAEFDIKKNCKEYHYKINLDAENAKEARKLLETLWYIDGKHKEHMFHINIRRLKAGEEFLYNWFVLGK